MPIKTFSIINLAAILICWPIVAQEKLIGVELVFEPKRGAELINELEKERPPKTAPSEERRAFSKKIFNIAIAAEKEVIASFLKQADERCKKQGVCKLKDKVVTYNDGFWFKLDQDIGIELEITTKPLVLSDWIKKESQIQEDIFNLAKSSGMVVNTKYGGHIHLDESFFDNDPVLFLNFFIDCQNHPELFVGIFGLRPNNPPLAAQPQKVRDAFKAFINNLTLSALKSWSIKELAQNLYDKIYKLTKSPRNNAINLQNLIEIPEDELTKEKRSFRTLEIRGLQAQSDAHELLLIIRYFVARINTIKNLYKNKIIKYNNKSVKLESESKQKKDAPNPAQIKQDFKNLIKDTQGISWEDGYNIFINDLSK